PAPSSASGGQDAHSPHSQDGCATRSLFAEAAARMESIIVAFAPILDNLPLEKSETVRSFSALIAPKTNAELDRLAGRPRARTRKQFGRTMRLFALLYLSNECINNCRYCGFSRQHPILRVTLSLVVVVKQSRH